MRVAGGGRLHRRGWFGRLCLQVLCSVKSEGKLMERIDYDLLFRRFVGLNLPHRLPRYPKLQDDRMLTPALNPRRTQP
jgi:hypothetical protein